MALLDMWEKALKRLQKSLGNAGEYSAGKMGGITGADMLKKKGPPLPPSRNAPAGIKAMGQAGMGIAAYEGFKQLGESTGISKKAEDWGARLRGDTPPMEYDPSTGRSYIKYGFKGLPESTMEQIRLSREPQTHEPSITAKLASGSRGAGGFGGGGSKDWQGRTQWLLEEFGLTPPKGEEFPYVIRGNKATTQHPFGSVAAQIGPENAAVLLSHIMTGTSHEVPSTMMGQAALGKLGLDKEMQDKLFEYMKDKKSRKDEFIVPGE